MGSLPCYARWQAAPLSTLVPPHADELDDPRRSENRHEAKQFPSHAIHGERGRPRKVGP